jgi:hypothetical protein
MLLYLFFPGKHIAATLKDGKICVYAVEDSSWERCVLTAHGDAVNVLHWSRCRVHSRSGSGGSLKLLRPPQLPAEGVPYVYPPMDEQVTVPVQVTGCASVRRKEMEKVCVGSSVSVR